jgi:hypothetical protein
MKVFWAWQADTDGQTSRHFIRAALLAAIKELKQPEEVEEPYRPIGNPLAAIWEWHGVQLGMNRRPIGNTPGTIRVIFQRHGLEFTLIPS